VNDPNESNVDLILHGAVADEEEESKYQRIHTEQSSLLLLTDNPTCTLPPMCTSDRKGDTHDKGESNRKAVLVTGAYPK
jgi:hypothetical protein